MSYKTLIIGASKGIGAAIQSKLENQDYKVIGMSRSTGFDIDKDDLSVIDLSSYSAIILNAYSNFTSQLKALYSIMSNNTLDKKTLVIVMSSMRALNTSSDTIARSMYSTEKASLNKVCRDFNNMGYNMSSVCPDYVDTEFNAGKNVPKLSVLSISNVVLMIIDNYIQNGILVKEIYIQKKV